MRGVSLVAMLKTVVILCLVGSIVAFPPNGARTKEEVKDLKEFLLKTKQDDDTTLEEKMARNPKASAWENSGKYEGDIVLFDEEIEEMVAEYAGNSTSANRNGLVNTRHRWPGGIVYYDIAANTFNNQELQMIQAGVNFFQETTCTRWVRRTNQRDYVLITGRQDGCYATVGYWQGWGAHTLNLARNGCFNLMIVIHEMLHSAGFHHMHQTYNRDNWILINWNNVEWSMRHNFDIHSNREVTMLGLPYEYASNQHYGDWAFSTNGQPTIVARFNTNGQMGQLTHITGYDIWRLARMYNCPGAWRVQANPEDANKPYTEEYFGKLLKQAAEEEIKERIAMLDRVIAEEENKDEENFDSKINVLDYLINEPAKTLDAEVNIVNSP